MSNPGLSCLVQQRCAVCEFVRPFTARLIRDRIDDEGYLIDQYSVESQLREFGWKQVVFKGGGWVCGNTCWEKHHES